MSKESRAMEGLQREIQEVKVEAFRQTEALKEEMKVLVAGVNKRVNEVKVDVAALEFHVVPDAGKKTSTKGK